MKKPHRRTSKGASRDAKKTAKPSPARANPSASATSCPVVGVGASAGGLDAFTELLKHLPQNTGFAFAFVQHLDPSRPSQLREILSRSTKMPVVEASDGVHMEPDQIYVIPPNASMSIADGTLQLAPRDEGAGPHLPVDYFFQSLASHRGNKAIGVVLSGNASDGTLGLKAIKAAGGISFAQAETSAKFPGMPRSAIGAGVVDFVLPPEKIASELARLGGTPYVKAEELPDVVEKGDGLRKIFRLLRASTGVDFASYRKTTIQRRIQRRMTVRRTGTIEDYVKLMEKNPDEVRAFFDDILIHVTNFFREPEAFATLAAQVFPELLKNRRAGEPIRVWLLGCSTGEEAYSLAISLLEFLGDRHEVVPIQIFGTDVSEKVIEAARKGVFDAGIEADVSPERLRRFFVKVERGYQINKATRDLCIFAKQNVIKDPPFSKLDLISCRNVLIYFEPELQKKLIPTFHYALKPGGYLLLGSAETVNSFAELFFTIDPKHKIFLRRESGNTRPPQVHFEEAHATQSDPREPGAPVHREVWSRLDTLKEADRLMLARFSPPAVVIDDEMEIIQFRGDVAPYLNPAQGEASLNLFKMTRSAFATELRTAIAAARKETPPPKKKPTLCASNSRARPARWPSK